ncbi:hypothetical protein PROFUN_04341, partial [Planoprotostelium fungivorum]
SRGNLQLDATVSLLDIEAELNPARYFAENPKSVPNVWRILIGTVAMEASHNLSPILSVKGGWTQDVSVVACVRRSDNRRVDAEISLKDISIHISCETASSAAAIARRVVEGISNEHNKALKMLGKHGLKDLRRQPAARSFSTLTKKRNQNWPIGSVIVRATNFSAFLFEFSLKDPSSAYININTCEVKLEQSRKEDELMSQLSLVLSGGRVSKMDEKGETFDEQSIMRFPVSTLILYSTRFHDTPEIDFYFLTEFNDSIVMALNINLYSFLKDVALNYVKTLSTTFASEPTAFPGPVKIYRRQKFQLSPTLSFLGDSTPSLDKVLRWLGIKNVDQTIPEGTFQIVELFSSLLLLFDENLPMVESL